MITQCDHIKSFNMGLSGCFDFDFVSLIHWEVREGGPTTEKQKFKEQKILYNMFAWDKCVASTLDGHVTMDPCLFQKATKRCEIKARVF